MDSSGNLVNGNFASGSLSPGWINESTTKPLRASDDGTGVSEHVLGV